MTSESDIDFLVKIVTVGDSGVGKTNLLSRFTRGSFSEDTHNTIGVDFSAVDLDIEGRAVKAQFWDTAGQEKYRAVASAYYKNAHGAIIVYDITRHESFANVEGWLNELREHGDKGIQLLIVGNKADLEGQRQVLTTQGQKLAENKRAFFVETSAKTNVEDGVGTSIRILLLEILKKLELDDRSKTESERFSAKSKSSLLQKSKKEDKGCCS